jgi:dTDP-4-amino-4,6-dideoxygalactose transaminase
MLAAFLYAQFEIGAAIQERRKTIWETYQAHLGDWASANGVKLPTVPPHCEQPYHMYYLIMPSLEARTAFIKHLQARSMLSVFHYLPLHLSDMGRKFGGKPGDCPVTEDLSDRLVRLPFYNDLAPVDQMRVIETICEFEFKG